MCITVTKDGNPVQVRVAKRNIKVYKILEGTHVLTSPYMSWPYELGEVKTVLAEAWQYAVERGSALGYRVGEGGLHTYGSVEKARNSGWSRGRIYEAIIPKGAEYYVGVGESRGERV